MELHFAHFKGDLMADGALPLYPTDQTFQSLLERVRLSDEEAWRRLADLYDDLGNRVSSTRTAHGAVTLFPDWIT